MKCCAWILSQRRSHTTGSLSMGNNVRQVVFTRTPLRVSFAGGGTELAAFYENSDYGAVLSTAINKYVYVTVKRHGEIFDEPIRLNYYESEKVQCVDDIQNNIIRECLKFLDIEPPI